MSTLSGSIEGARGSPVDVHEHLASNLHPGRRQVCAPFLMFVNGAITLKTSSQVAFASRAVGSDRRPSLMPGGGPLERRGYPKQRDLVVGAADELHG